MASPSSSTPTPREGLRRDLALVAEQLTAALADTRRALTTLGPDWADR